MLQYATLGVRQERYGEAELHRVGPTEIDAKAILSFLVRKLREKFPARFALGTSRLVASRPTIAMARLDSAKTTEPPVKATIETMKMSARATNALPVNTVRFSRVAGFSSSALTTDTATTSNPKMAADAPALAMKKFAYWPTTTPHYRRA